MRIPRSSRFPLLVARSPSSASPTARPSADDAQDSCVLIVTDVGAESLARELERRKFVPTVVAGGALAIDALVRNRFDLLFIDAELPGLLSSRPPPQKAGPLGYLRKPVSSTAVDALLALCRDLKIRVVAEGIETKDELDALVKLDCELFQGYLFARPAMSI